MSINWVMLDEHKNFIPLPKERILYTSPPRTTFSLTTPNTFPGKTPLSIQSNAGKAFVTNQRIVYLPSSPTAATGSAGVSGNLQSFTSPLLNLSDTHVTAPFFGPNAWIAVLRPVTGGGIPANHAYVELKLVFKDGGAFDFHSTYERVREQVVHAVDVARESGRNVSDAIGDVAGEDLPAYDGPGVNPAPGPAYTAPSGAPAPIFTTRSVAGGQLQETHLLDADIPPPSGPPPNVEVEQRQPVSPPNEDPPGYEDVQRAGVADSLEERLRRQAS